MADDSDGEFVEWAVTLDRLYFTTKVYADTDARASEAEEVALERLIKSLKSGEISPTWKTSARFREDIHAEARQMYTQVCDYCNEYTEEEKRELVVGDEVQFVCPSCVAEVRDRCNECGRSRDELSASETMEVEGRTVVEYICSSCLQQTQPAGQ
jgi:hypothetical protein